MPNNISKIFEKPCLSAGRQKSLIIYITAGDPSLKITEKLILDFEKAGADIIELGIPFSDPLADGPVIQASHLRAVKNNISLKDAFSLVKNVRKKTQIPLVFMLTCNFIEKYGVDKFHSDCEKNGVSGILIPDSPPNVFFASQPLSLASILMVAPSTPEERIKKIADAASGFIYLVSVMGITGKRTALSSEISTLVQKIRKFTNKPIAVGFGITTTAQAKEASKSADCVIVGSAIVDLISKKKYKQAIKLVGRMRRAIDAK